MDLKWVDSWRQSKGHTILQQKFGVWYASAWLDTPQLGIGFGNNFSTSYDNFIDQLFLQGITQSREFSVDLGSVDSSAGLLLAVLYYAHSTNLFRLFHYLWRYWCNKVLGVLLLWTKWFLGVTCQSWLRGMPPLHLWRYFRWQSKELLVSGIRRDDLYFWVNYMDCFRLSRASRAWYWQDIQLSASDSCYIYAIRCCRSSQPRTGEI
jgi:hypothetical protein